MEFRGRSRSSRRRRVRSRPGYRANHFRQTELNPVVPQCGTLAGEACMEETQVGWIAAIIIGGIAGWLAEQFMHSQMGLLMNIVLGIIGAAIAGWLFGL